MKTSSCRANVSYAVQHSLSRHDETDGDKLSDNTCVVHSLKAKTLNEKLVLGTEIHCGYRAMLMTTVNQ
jgi:hypothetical protein